MAYALMQRRPPITMSLAVDIQWLVFCAFTGKSRGRNGRSRACANQDHLDGPFDKAELGCRRLLRLIGHDPLLDAGLSIPGGLELGLAGERTAVHRLRIVHGALRRWPSAARSRRLRGSDCHE